MTKYIFLGNVLLEIFKSIILISNLKNEMDILENFLWDPFSITITTETVTQV